jgi:hypothetical protein
MPHDVNGRETIGKSGGNIADIFAALMKWPSAVKAENSEMPILAAIVGAVLNPAAQRRSTVKIRYEPTSNKSKKVFAPVTNARQPEAKRTNSISFLCEVVRVFDEL